MDPVNREILMGLPVANGDVVILRHCLSGQLLCLEPKLKHTDFGAERIVTARTVIDVRRRKALELIKQVRFGLISSHLISSHLAGVCGGGRGRRDSQFYRLRSVKGSFLSVLRQWSGI